MKVSDSESERSRKIYLAEIDWHIGFEEVLHSRESFAELMFYLFLKFESARSPRAESADFGSHSRDAGRV